jgi:diguanylate cyclase (GGDEF)-like protein
MAATVASHLPGSLCAIRIQVPDDDQISLYPEFPRALAEACERVDLSSIKETLTAAPLERLSGTADWSRYLQAATQEPHRLYRAVPVVRDSRRVGVILSFLREDCADSLPQQKLLESWGRFASLAVERRGLYKQLSFRAQYDSLTSLLNRASLYERLSGLMRGASGVGGTSGGSLGIIYLDLDSFKEINDTLGHGAGDVVLKHVASQIVSSVRRTDAVARIGGDEFVIVLPGVADRGEVVQVADTVAAAITVPVDVENRLLAVSASLGISMYPLDGTDIDTLLKVADESMYKVKLTHRSRRASEALEQQSAVAV